MKRWRWLLAAVVVAIVVLAMAYLRCGGGWGLGRGGAGDGRAVVAGSAGTSVSRCTVKVTAAGLLVDGRIATRDEVVAACKSTGGAIVTVVGNAREGDWIELRQALEAAGVTVLRAGT